MNMYFLHQMKHNKSSNTWDKGRASAREIKKDHGGNDISASLAACFLC